MNRVAYRTTELAIKVLAKILKANSRFHDVENIPGGPIIFVINHFTRLETLLLPYYLYHLVDRSICSLADDSLFHGMLKSYFDRVGVVSTRDPQRDKLIVRSLIAAEADWIIFPEGRMVKNKKIVNGREFMVGDGEQARSPHTGPAWLALRAEIIRRGLMLHGRDRRNQAACFADRVDIGEDDPISDQSVKIVPVNLTYYPIRARENVLSDMALRYVEAPSERMIEELMAEGTMFLEGVDIDIRIGRPLDMADYMAHPAVSGLIEHPSDGGLEQSPEVNEYLRATSRRLMQLYMRRIYEATTVNHDHIQASLLRRRSFKPFTRSVFAAKTHLAIASLQGHPELMGRLHRSLQTDQAHLLTCDRFGKIESFVGLALESGFLDEDESGRLKKNKGNWGRPLSMHEARIANTGEVIANEIEPLGTVQRCLNRAHWTPDRLAPLINGFMLHRHDQRLYRQERGSFKGTNEIDFALGRPFLLPARTRRAGVVVLHSYLSVPEEIKPCASLFRKNGFWVYGVRLPGHGTCPESLALKEVEDWRLALDRGVAILASVCREICVVGFSVGGMLALDLASRCRSLAGVVAVCPPYELSDYSQRFMPSKDIWERLLTRWKGSRYNQKFVAFEPENHAINYHRNPVAGVNQVGELLNSVREGLDRVLQPALVVGVEEDQVVGGDSARRVYEKVGSRKKELLIVPGSRHNIIYGDHSGIEKRVREAVASFLLSALG